MNILLSICLIVSIYFTMRSLTTAVIKWRVYEYRKETVIERINERQRKVDILVGVYQSITSLFWLFVMSSLINTLFDILVNDSVYVITSLVIICLYLCYHVLCYIFETKYGISAFYYDMIEYRSKQKVVTLDNDYEVSYMRACKSYFMHRKIVILLVVSLLLYILFVL